MTAATTLGRMTSEAGGRSLAQRTASRGKKPARKTMALKVTARKPAAAASGNGTGHGSRNGAGHGSAAHLETVRIGAPTTPSSLVHDDPLDILLNEAQAAVSDSANTLRDVRERYRTAYLEQVDRWERLRTQTAGGSKSPNGGQGGEAAREAMAGREVTQERSTLGRIELAVKSLENA